MEMMMSRLIDCTLPRTGNVNAQASLGPITGPSSDVQERINSLTERARRLSEQSANLEERLGAVLVPRGQLESAPEASSMGACELSRQLALIEGILDATSEQMGGMLAALCL